MKNNQLDMKINPLGSLLLHSLDLELDIPQHSWLTRLRTGGDEEARGSPAA